jgi:hypothetical protein
MQVCLVQAVVAPHVPAAVHVCAPLLVVHCVAAGEHTTHPPFKQTGIAPEHVLWLCHCPVESHCWTTAPTHCV